MEGSYPHLEGSPMQTFSQAQLLQQQPQMFLQQGSTHSHLRFMQIQKQHLQRFWQQQVQEMRQIAEFKQHQLPLARIKKIMKSDEEVKMISAEAPVLFSKACELFILELTLRSWLHTEENKRRTLQRNDIAGAVSRGDILDFLVDIVRRDDIKDEQYGGHWTDLPHVESMPYGGIPLHLMNSQPYHHSLHTEAVTYNQALSQQFISQEPLIPDQQLMYHPPQH